MKTYKYTLIKAIIKDASSQWAEKFRISNHLTKDECKQTLDGFIASFNSTLRQNELPRTLVSFTFVHLERKE